MKPTAKTIRENLRTNGQEPPDAKKAFRLAPKELDRAEAQAQSKNGHSEEARQALADHAAWFIREHLPAASFPNHPEDETLPTGKAIAHLARVWPQNGYREAEADLPSETEKSAAEAGRRRKEPRSARKKTPGSGICATSPRWSSAG